MSKYTQKPWRVEFFGGSRKCGVTDLQNHNICTLTHNKFSITDEEAKANARLIAAAPEMHEALEDAKARFESIMCLCEEGSRFLRDITIIESILQEAFEAQKELKAVIERAEGE